MIIDEEKTITDLTASSVSIKTEQFIDLNGKKTKVGGIHRVTYSNSPDSRKALIFEQPEDVSAAVIKFWGDTPTFEDPVIFDKEEKITEQTQEQQTQEESINEEQGEATQEGGKVDG